MTIKIGHSFKNLSVLSATSEASGYPASNIADANNMLRGWRSTDTTEQIIVIDVGAAVSIEAIILDDCNFEDVDIEVHDANSWGTPNDSQSVELQKDSATQRYKIWHAPVSTSDRYVRLAIDAQAPTDGAAYFRIGRIIIPGTVFAPKHNIAYGYSRKSAIPKHRNEFLSGTHETAYLGNNLIWEGSIAWNYYPGDDINDLLDLNYYMQNGLIAFYENSGDSSKAYIAEMWSEIDIEIFNYEAEKTSSITLREKI